MIITIITKITDNAYIVTMTTILDHTDIIKPPISIEKWKPLSVQEAFFVYIVKVKMSLNFIFVKVIDIFISKMFRY